MLKSILDFLFGVLMSTINVEFSNYITDLTHGAIEQLNAADNSNVMEKATSIALANYTLGILRMLRGKTVGNLKDEERQLLDAVISEISEKL
jgi:hypothetical protein